MSDYIDNINKSLHEYWLVYKRYPLSITVSIPYYYKLKNDFCKLRSYDITVNEGVITHIRGVKINKAQVVYCDGKKSNFNYILCDS